MDFLVVHTGTWYSDVVVYACWAGIILGAPWILREAWREAKEEATRTVREQEELAKQD